MIKAAITTVALATAGAVCWFHGSAICHAFMAALHR
jgi:hypothetical protein